MGTDKAFLPFPEGGRPMIASIIERLRAVAIDITNEAEKHESLGVLIVPDEYAEVGVLGGIHAALRHAAHDHCLVVACDMPFLNPMLLRQMAEEPRDYDVLIPMTPGESRQGGRDGVLQTLHAIYGKRCLPAIESRIRSGLHQVVGFFDEVSVTTMEEAQMRLVDPHLRSFFNANTPEAYAMAISLVKHGEPSQHEQR
jgi:molybdopterin-guanine dinucleotide biosynthesis protein A